MRKTRLPNAAAVHVLGVSSITLVCCYGLPGIATGIIALILYNKDKALYEQNKDKYHSIEHSKTGRTLSIIGITVSSLYFIYLVTATVFFGSEAFLNPGFIFSKIKEFL